MTLHVSLVIRTYGLERLPEIFAITARQQTSSIIIKEIILVNGHPKILLEPAMFPSHPPVIVTTPGSAAYTPGRALNTGVRATTGDIVLFLSGHSVPATTSWLHALCSPFSDPFVAGVLGRHIPWTESNWLEKLYRNVWYNSTIIARLFRHFNLANAAIRRTLWEHHHFNEKLQGCEDRLWARHFRECHAAKFVFSKRAAVFHSHLCSAPSTFRYILWLWKLLIDSHRLERHVRCDASP